ncbi:MAG: rod shape-determining protein RodA [Spirochaetia bacterium]|nr:rod shape-determining protein RodA [Spirochaetia bacterium]
MNNTGFSDQKKSFFGFDFFLAVMVLALCTVGILFIYSSGINSDNFQTSSEFIKQIVFCVIGIVFSVLILFVDYSRFRFLSVYLYCLSLIVLVFLLIFSPLINGSRSWIGIAGFGIQPSEFVKIAYILIFARFIENKQKEIRTMKVFAEGFLLMLVPAGLVLLQPDLGTASVYFAVFFIMFYVGGGNSRYIFFSLMVVLLTSVITVLPHWEILIAKRKIPILLLLTDPSYYFPFLFFWFFIFAVSAIGFFVYKKSFFYKISYISLIFFISLILGKIASDVLKDYQIKRLIVFLDPKVDPYGSGYHILQSLTVIGSGGFSGKGFMNGTLGKYDFLPQRSTDFIFSTIAEEWGFAGCFFVLALFAMIMLKILLAARDAKDVFGRLICIGVFALIFYHMVINIGMTIGVMPITGIPLIFISYGGSSLISSLIGIAFVLNIRMRRFGI